MGNFGPGSDPSMEGGDPSQGGANPMGNFGPGSDPSMGGGDPSLGGGNPMGNFGAGPGSDPAAGGAGSFGTGSGNSGGVPSADLATIRKSLMSNSYENVTVAKLQLFKITSTTLGKIHDAATAIAQADQFKELEPVFKLASDSTKRIKPSQAERLQLARKYGVAGKQILEAYEKEVARVMKVKGFPTPAKLQLQKMIQLAK